MSHGEVVILILSSMIAGAVLMAGALIVWLIRHNPLR